MAEKKPTGGKRTKNAVPFSSQLDQVLHDKFKARVEAEQRTVRAVLERALWHYLETVPVNGPGKK
jgi:hypothetical protein